MHVAFKAASSWFLFHEVVKNSCSQSLIDQQVKFFLENKMHDKTVTVNSTNNAVKYYEFPHICRISKDITRKL